MRMKNYQLVTCEMHHDVSRNAVKGSNPLNVDSFSFVSLFSILLLGVAEMFEMSSGGRSTI